METMSKPVFMRQAVVFVDSVGQCHEALVTAVHTMPREDGSGRDAQGHNVVADKACAVNLVLVQDDASMRDPYGRQLVRHTSVVHGSLQPAGGMYWRHYDETPKANELPL